MGQKSNTLTPKKIQKSLNFQGNVKELKEFLYGVMFLSFLEKKLLNQKNITLIDKTLNFVNNEVYLSLALFFKTTKLKSYKKKYIKSLKSLKKQDDITRFILSELSLLKSNLNSLNLRVTNKEVNGKLAKLL
jgi:hypothetical protein